MHFADAQDSRPNPFAKKTDTERIEILHDAVPVKTSESKFENSSFNNFEFMKSVQLNIYKAPVIVKENFHFNLIESVNSNVKFGGFYNGSVNIQFSPAMYIKPFSFLSVYANHQKNLFIPMDRLTDNAYPLAIETSGLILIENALKFIAPSNKVVKGLTEFALKNCVSFLVSSIFSSSQNSSQNGIYKYDFYYISAGITF